MAKTNGDVFRSMTNAEIAEFMSDYIDCCDCPIRKLDCEDDCNQTWFEYLERTVSK